MEKKYEVPESEEIKVCVEENFLQTGHGPDIPGGEDDN